MIDSFIIGRVLTQVPHLTIPNFGTLLKKSNGEIVFSQFLCNDDMMFASIVMNSYHVDASKAKQMVAEFVTDMEDKINATGTYTLPELGSFYLDSSGSVRFNKEFIAPQPPVIPQKETAEIPQKPDIPQPQVIDPPTRTQVVPQPIIGTSHQGFTNRSYPGRTQAPLSSWQQQTIPQRPQSPSQKHHQHPQGRNIAPQQRQQGPQRSSGGNERRNKTQKTEKKTDYILIVAIIVALAVAVLIAYSLLFSPTELTF